MMEAARTSETSVDNYFTREQKTILNFIKLSRKIQNTVERMSGDKYHKGNKYDHIATYKVKCRLPTILHRSDSKNI
jgi:hypothetical protein